MASSLPRSPSGIKRISHFWVENCAVRYAKAGRPHVRYGSIQSMSALPPKADIGTQPRNVRFVPKADIGTPRRSGVHQIDRTKKIHLTDVDAVVSEDGIGHRDVEKSVRDCHLQQVILAVDDLVGCPR